MRLRWKFCFLLILLGLVGSGCSGPGGPPLAEVNGVVLLDGRPLPQARVVFQPQQKGSSPSYAQTSENGEFALEFNQHRKGAMPGAHQVQITTRRIVTDDRGNETEIKEKLPTEYNKRSKLEYEVKPGKNQFEIKLSSNATAG